MGKTVPEKHKHEAPQSVRVSLITVSTSRYRAKMESKEAADESGSVAEGMLESNGHAIVSRKVIDDDLQMVRFEVLRSVVEQRAEVVILMGGTGVSPKDVTIEAISPLLDKELTGFVDLFRNVSFKEIGTSAYMSRVTAGTIGKTVVFALPGSPGAVETALKLILPELGHAVFISSGA
jgi:molybdenum cofactor biosynthesis protein B